MTHPVLLQAIVIDATNKVINFREGANTATATLVESTYYLRGDGAADDFCLALKTALETNNGARTSTNTYSVVPAWSADPGARGCIVTITRLTGADSFQLLTASTTFDQALIGFDFAADALNAGPKSSSTSPTSVWVGDNPVREFEPVDHPVGYAKRSRAGKVRRGKTGNTRKDRRLGLGLVCAVRTHEAFVAAGGDVERCFNRFLDRWRAGKPAEIHLTTPSSGFTLAALSSSTEQGTGWHVGEDGEEEFAARRLNPSTGLYAWGLEVWPDV